jgi:hypothetical protein
MNPNIGQNFLVVILINYYFHFIKCEKILKTHINKSTYKLFFNLTLKGPNFFIF